jgi:hypothetical protein
MPRLLTIIALAAVLAAAALGIAAGASGATAFGIADDAGKYAHDGGSNFFLLLNDLGFTQNRITVTWAPTDGNNGLTIRERGFLDRTLPVAAIRGIDVVLDVYPLRAKAFAVDTQKRIELFAQYLQLLARTYPQVTRFVVGNEPNQPRFNQPQFVRSGRRGYRAPAGALYARLLAAAYDALKAVNPRITVIGLGLSPRGNDNPRARNNISRSPVRFIRDLAAEYRRSGRTRPLMDELGFHPYPSSNAAPLSRGYGWPNVGIPNLSRIKQAIWDGFHGTAQPVFAETPLYGEPAPHGPSLGLTLDEYGRQVTVISSVASAYHGRENVRTITEGRQANMYAAVLRRVACDPAVTSFFYFHLIDDPDLDRFQSGLLRINGTKRPAYGAVKAALQETKGQCGGAPRAWRHATTVIGAEVSFDEDGTITVCAAEDASVTTGLFPGTATNSEILDGLSRRLASSRATHPRLLRAYRPAELAFDVGTPRRRTYVRAVVLRALMNPERTFVAVSDPVAGRR